jgi:hypothetical protein
VILEAAAAAVSRRAHPDDLGAGLMEQLRWPRIELDRPEADILNVC